MRSLGSLRYGDYGLQTTTGRALSFVCSTGLSCANIDRQDCTTDSRLREKRRRGKQHAKIFLFSSQFTKMQRSVLHVILSLEQEQILPYLKEAISSGEIGKQSLVTQVLFFSPMNSYVKY